MTFLETVLATVGDATVTHVLYVITDLDLGGVPLHLHRLTGAVRSYGFEASVVSLAPPGPVGDRLRADGVEVLSCDARGAWDFRVIRRLARIIRTRQPDIIHSMLFHANLASRGAAWMAGFPGNRVICEIQTVEVERTWHLRLDRWTCGKCRYVIGNSPSVIEHLENIARIPRDRLRLIRGGIDSNPLRDATPIDLADLGLPSEAAIVLWAGRFDPVKGLDLLVDSFREVVDRCDAHLLLAGGPVGGALFNSIRKRINRLSLAERVHLLGPRNDVPRLLKTADVFVLPSRTEGLPNALLEAMAAGCPIVATDVPGCRDLIEHEQTGLLVPYANTGALADALLRLLTDPSLAQRLGQNASTLVERSWSAERNYREYYGAYGELVGGEPSLLDRGG